MTLKRDPNIEGKLTFCLKNDMRNLVNFVTRAAESLKVFTLMGHFCRKYVVFELNKIQRTCVIKNDVMAEVI